MIMPCMNSTSADDAGGSVALIVLGRERVGFPGAPGCTTTGFAGSVCCAHTGKENRIARVLAATSMYEHTATISVLRIPPPHVFRWRGLTYRWCLSIAGLRLSHLGGTSHSVLEPESKKTNA